MIYYFWLNHLYIYAINKNMLIMNYLQENSILSTFTKHFYRTKTSINHNQEPQQINGRAFQIICWSLEQFTITRCNFKASMSLVTLPFAKMGKTLRHLAVKYQVLLLLKKYEHFFPLCDFCWTRVNDQYDRYVSNCSISRLVIWNFSRLLLSVKVRLSNISLILFIHLTIQSFDV